MYSWVDLDELDAMKFARSIERDCQEGVKWERRKLQWILEEERNEPVPAIGLMPNLDDRSHRD
jgi:hypothetical protein